MKVHTLRQSAVERVSHRGSNHLKGRVPTLQLWHHQCHLQFRFVLHFVNQKRVAKIRVVQKQHQTLDHWHDVGSSLADISSLSEVMEAVDPIVRAPDTPSFVMERFIVKILPGVTHVDVCCGMNCFAFLVRSFIGNLFSANLLLHVFLFNIFLFYTCFFRTISSKFFSISRLGLTVVW